MPWHELLEPRIDVFGLVVDRQVGPQLLAQRDLLIAAGGGGHPRADGLGDLHHGRADATAAAVDEQCFAGLQLRSRASSERGRDAGQRDRATASWLLTPGGVA